jgi:hypothetical protein
LVGLNLSKAGRLIHYAEVSTYSSNLPGAISNDLRRWYFKKSTPRKAGSLPQQTQAWYTESENRREEAFNESRLQQQQRCTDEEKLQWEREKLRNEQFERTMITMNETFRANEEHRNKAFQDAEAEQEGNFRDNETLREKRFKERMVSREECFRRYQGIQKKHSEWYANVRNTHVRQGRQARERSCQELERQMLEQFNALVRFQEESFGAAEHQRDEIMKETVSCVWTLMTTSVHIPYNAFSWPTENPLKDCIVGLMKTG